MKLHILTLLVLLSTLTMSAQNINIQLASYPNKELTVSLKYGMTNDTIWLGMTDNKGIAKAVIPDEYASYQGMATLSIEQSSLDFIVASGENPLIICNDEYLHGGNLIFEHSPENQSLQSWFFAQAIRKQKLGLLSELEKMYKPTDMFYNYTAMEKELLSKQQSLFLDTLANSKLYAARFIGLRNLLSERIAPLVVADSLQMLSMRTFVKDSLDINSLYTSGMWFNAINGLLAIYGNDSPFHKEFVNDMAVLLKRCDDKIYTTLAENLFSICESTGWNDLEEQLAYFLINDGRIEKPTGKLEKLMTLFKLSKGSKVPALTQTDLLPGKTLLVFYESGCGSCENEMLLLRANYPLIKEKGYRVISIAADSDMQVFKNTAQAYPWQDKYRDAKGFLGEDFKNYGVIGIPTFYLMNENGILDGRYARLEDTKLLNP